MRIVATRGEPVLGREAKLATDGCGFLVGGFGNISSAAATRSKQASANSGTSTGHENAAANMESSAELALAVPFSALAGGLAADPHRKLQIEGQSVLRNLAPTSKETARDSIGGGHAKSTPICTRTTSGTPCPAK